MKTSDNKEQPSEQCSINLFSSRMCERGTACCETRHTQPSEHAMRAAEKWAAPFKPNPELAECIDQHAIAPAVAERDRRIAELDRRCKVLDDALAEIGNLQDSWPQWGYQDLYESSRDRANAARVTAILATHGGAHE